MADLVELKEIEERVILVGREYGRGKPGSSFLR